MQSRRGSAGPLSAAEGLSRLRRVCAGLRCGAAVRVGGVASRPELNGRRGTVVVEESEAGRLGVRVEGLEEASLHRRGEEAPSAWLTHP